MLIGTSARPQVECGFAPAAARCSCPRRKKEALVCPPSPGISVSAVGTSMGTSCSSQKRGHPPDLLPLLPSASPGHGASTASLSPASPSPSSSPCHPEVAFLKCTLILTLSKPPPMALSARVSTATGPLGTAQGRRVRRGHGAAGEVSGSWFSSCLMAEAVPSVSVTGCCVTNHPRA